MENDNKQSNSYVFVTMIMIVLVAVISFLGMFVLVNNNNKLVDLIEQMQGDIDGLEAMIIVAPTPLPTIYPTPSIIVSPLPSPTPTSTPDIAHPVISLIEARATGADSAFVRWSTNEPAQSRLVCDGGGAHFESNIIGQRDNDFEATITGLVSSTQYICNIKATDVAGNINQSNNFHFITF
jgi:hypothetical protein